MAIATRPKPPAHHKKRSGKHHRHSKHYLTPYWPYLPLVAIVVCGLLIVNLLGIRGGVLGASTGSTVNELLSATNQQRSLDHEQPLKLNDTLARAAQAKAADMVARNYWSHDTPDGRTPWSFMQSAGYTYASAGENLAYGFSSAGAAVTGWMNSPEHRANILDGDYTEVGFGVVTSQDYLGHGPATLLVAFYAKPKPGVNITFTVNNPEVSADRTVSATDQPAQSISLVQQFTGGAAPWSLAVVVFLSAAAAMLLITRHALAWHRFLVRSESFVIKHPVFDMMVITVATCGYVLMQTSGIIR